MVRTRLAANVVPFLDPRNSAYGAYGAAAAAASSIPGGGAGAYGNGGGEANNLPNAERKCLYCPCKRGKFNPPKAIHFELTAVETLIDKGIVADW